MNIRKTRLPDIRQVPPIGLVVLALLLWQLQQPMAVLAEQLKSNSYTIQFGNFNITSGEKNSASYNVTDTVGQLAAGPFGTYNSTTYFVGSGFQYIYQIPEFSFTISSLAIDFGQLIANTPVTRTHTLTITTRGGSGYKVYAIADAPPTSLTSANTIPSTICDAGTCTISSAQPWVNSSTTGFGYNMGGHDIPGDFTNSTYFRPFPITSLGQTIQQVMGSTNIATNRQSTVTYKINIPGDQASGQYETAVKYIAVPGY